MLGIPAFKLRSNDRWLVTAREIDEALAAYDEFAAGRNRPGWPSRSRARGVQRPVEAQPTQPKRLPARQHAVHGGETGPEAHLDTGK